MPKLIDYSARVELLREAVVAITLRDGALALDFSTVSAELGTSVATVRRIVASADCLPSLGAGLLQRHRRTRARLRTVSRLMSGPEPWQRPLAVLAASLPIDQDLAEETRAWTRLTETYALTEPRIAGMLAEHEQEIGTLVAHVVAAALSDAAVAADEEYELRRLRALVDGLTAAVVARRLDPEAVLPLLHRHVRAVAAEAEKRVA